VKGGQGWEGKFRGSRGREGKGVGKRGGRENLGGGQALLNVFS